MLIACKYAMPPLRFSRAHAGALRSTSWNWTSSQIHETIIMVATRSVMIIVSVAGKYYKNPYGTLDTIVGYIMYSIPACNLS